MDEKPAHSAHYEAERLKLLMQLPERETWDEFRAKQKAKEANEETDESLRLEHRKQLDAEREKALKARGRAGGGDDKPIKDRHRSSHKRSKRSSAPEGSPTENADGLSVHGDGFRLSAIMNPGAADGQGAAAGGGGSSSSRGHSSSSRHKHSSGHKHSSRHRHSKHKVHSKHKKKKRRHRSSSSSSSSSGSSSSDRGRERGGRSSKPKGEKRYSVIDGHEIKQKSQSAAEAAASDKRQEYLEWLNASK